MGQSQKQPVPSIELYGIAFDYSRQNFQSSPFPKGDYFSG
jgi:hypothetical protein